MGFLDFLRGRTGAPGAPAGGPTRPEHASGVGITSPDDVTRARFTPVRFAEGYDISEVDDALDGPLIAAWREDRALLDQLERQVADLRAGADGAAAVVLARSEHRPGPEDVHRMRFTPVRFSEGYAMEDVDLFLDEMSAAWAKDLERITALQQEAEALRRA